MTGSYIEAHPNPHARQYTAPRRAAARVVCVHTAESVLDVIGPDGGAEGVAAFISRRADAGSYNVLVDSDSIIDVVPLGWEAWGDATGGNRFEMHLSFALRAEDWPRLTDERRRRFLTNGAVAANRMREFALSTYGSKIPTRRLTRPESETGFGFIDHSRRDPARRHDPGDGSAAVGGAEFPWAEWFDLITGPVPTPTQPEEPMLTIYVRDDEDQTGPVYGVLCAKDRAGVWRGVAKWRIPHHTVEAEGRLGQPLDIAGFPGDFSLALAGVPLIGTPRDLWDGVDAVLDAGGRP